MEKLEGVERAEVDWRGKEAEVFGTADGFDPAQLPEAVRQAGFVAPEADIGIDVSVVGRVDVEEGRLVLALPKTRWKLIGARLPELRESAASEAFRLTGSFTSDADGRPVLEVESWEAVSGGG